MIFFSYSIRLFIQFFVVLARRCIVSFDAIVYSVLFVFISVSYVALFVVAGLVVVVVHLVCAASNFAAYYKLSST